MLIRLVPSSSQPTVLFKLVFENLSETLQTPTAWVNHLAALDSDDLEIPELLHALDKAVGVVSLCDEVVFNMIDKKIKCVLCDGEVEEWDIGSEYFGKFVEIAHQRTADLIRRLDGVIDDVNESAAEIERERKRAEERKEQQRIKEEQELEAAKPQETSTMCTSGRKKKLGHKKQRSLLMNLVSSLIPLSLNSPRPSSYPSSRSPSPASSTRSTHAEKFVTQTTSAPPTLSRSVTLPTPRSRNSRPVSVSSLSSPLTTIESPLSSPTVVIVAPPPPPPLSPRALRRRARSTLVDAFRIYVLPELTKRVRCSRIAGSVVNAPVPFYGSDTSAPYYPWIVSSMLKRVDTRLSEIGRELQEEMDAIGIELSALPLNVLAGIGLGPIQQRWGYSFSFRIRRRCYRFGSWG
ncbi:hypothetical protein GYMLUDRAFT_814659 [Collybiopsis luxurians FD-317 M1]|nr:hypothetical protein GYMLUDRAFT_814659 [Collybiopsis luxurians FD-317 M1]